MPVLFSPFSIRCICLNPISVSKANCVWDKFVFVHHKRQIEKNAKNISIVAATLAAVTYNYALVCQGKLMDTKQMMIVQ